MEAEHASQLPLSASYNALLNRYARMITRDEAAAGELVKKALEELRLIDPLTQESLRRQLQSDLRALCFSWQLEKDAANFKGRAFTEVDGWLVD